MTMEQAIRDFFKQFVFEPEIINTTPDLAQYERWCVVGMGGSHLAADIIHDVNPALDLLVYHDYGLPASSHNRLIICSSYSGNTEEVIDAYRQAHAQGLTTISIAIGGQLIELAKHDRTAYIVLPDTGIQPRSALGYSYNALLKAMGQDQALTEASDISRLHANDFESIGQDLATKLRGKLPIIYSSGRNISVAYNWKIKFNETGKIPAFYNTLPELNHNEMNGFDHNDHTAGLSDNFSFIFLTDSDDHPRINKRFAILEKLYTERGYPVERLELQGNNHYEKIFRSLIIADWASYYTALNYGLDPEQVPMVEQFKELMAE